MIVGAMLKILKSKKVIDYKGQFLMYPMHKEEKIKLLDPEYDPQKADWRTKVFQYNESIRNLIIQAMKDEHFFCELQETMNTLRKDPSKFRIWW